MRKLQPKKKPAPKTKPAKSKASKKNDRVLFGFAILVGLMIGLSYASVPLYTLFCKATGFGGTPQRVVAAQITPAASENTPASAAAVPQSTDAPAARSFTVTFDGNVDPALPWDFAPETKSVQVKLGEQVTVKYRAHNRGDKAVVGTATYNVQPDRAGAYFDKVQCFCFTKQLLKAGQTAELAVTFYIDPAIAKDHQNDDVQNITLSYTFFRAKNQGLADKLKVKSGEPAYQDPKSNEPAYQDPNYPSYN